MNYRSFEELPVWKDAIDLAARILRMGEAGALRGRPGFRDQIERAVASISNNIAEGYERGTHNDRLTFLYCARGSAGETRSMLALLHELDLGDEHDHEVKAIYDLCLSVSRQLGSWIEALKESDNRGDRYRTEATRQSKSNAQRRDEYLDHLRRIQEEHRLKSPSSTAPEP